MATGLHTTNLVHAILNHLRGGAAWTQPAGIYIKVHLGDPGAAGTANPSAVTTRSQATFAAASAGAIALSNTPSFAMTATEALTHISAWDAASGGNVLFTGALGSTRNVNNGDTFNLTSLGVALTPVMA